MYKSQNNETELVLNYFSDKHWDKSVLSIGENDGVTFSNSYDLIQNGWLGYLIEPSPKAFAKLKELYQNHPKVHLFNFGIANETGKFNFNESGSYNHTGEDVALLSSLIDSEMDRWGNSVSFEGVEAEFKTFNDFVSRIIEPKFDYITIDAEGYDYDILKQINLDQYSCQCVCIEHNGKPHLIDLYRKYCVGDFKMKEISFNPENLIFVK
jgi:FkbM family methyltransferase